MDNKSGNITALNATHANHTPRDTTNAMLAASLLGLPLELRILIYDYFFTSYALSRKFCRQDKAVLLVCRQICAEALKPLYPALKREETRLLHKYWNKCSEKCRLCDRRLLNVEQNLSFVNGIMGKAKMGRAP